MNKSQIFAKLLILSAIICLSQSLFSQPKDLQYKGNKKLSIKNLDFQFFQHHTTLDESKFQEIKSRFLQQKIQEELKSEEDLYFPVDSQNNSEFKHFVKMVERYQKERFSKINSNSYNECYEQEQCIKQEVLKVNIKINQIEKTTDVIDATKMKENYKITIDSNENGEFVAEFICEGYVSFLRAIETFYQLFEKKTTKFSQLPLEINDEPSYQWRGIMLDCSRHFEPVDEIKKQIDGLRVNKMNVLHLHFTDSESFPVEIPDIPDLSQYGAYNAEQTYKVSDVQEIISYGQENGVVIIPEFDAPAHTTSWSFSPRYEETNACGEAPAQSWFLYCGQPPCGALNPAEHKTWDLVTAVADYQKSTFPSTYLHLGGDEVEHTCWQYTKSIKEWMDQNDIANYNELEVYFRQRQSEIVGNDRKKLYWMKGKSAKTSIYNDDDIIQFWNSSDKYDLLEDMPNPVVLSTYDYLYFDCGLGNWFGGPAWCGPFETWSHVYNFKPKKANLGERLLGAEACLWGELISGHNLDSTTWPRAASLGLRLWNEDENLSSPDLARTIVEISDTLYDVYGIRATPISTEYCTRNIDKCFFY